MPPLARHPVDPPDPDESLHQVARAFLAAVAGLVVAVGVSLALTRLPGLRGHDIYEARLIGPAAVGGLTVGILGIRRSPWASVISTSVGASATACAVLCFRADSGDFPQALTTLAVATVLCAVGGAVAGWMLARRRAKQVTWARAAALAAGICLGAVGLVPHAALPHVADGFGLLVLFGERQLPAPAFAPIGVPWMVSAVLVASATRLPQPVLILAGTAAGLTWAADAASGAAHGWLGTTVACLRPAVLVVALGLVLQAIHELRSGRRKGSLRRAKPC